MAKRSGGTRPKRGGARKARVASKGLKVTAVKATAGRAATSVQVEVEPEELKSEVGEFQDVKTVSARIPEDEGRGVHWREERLQHSGTSEEEREGRRRVVHRYFNVHYGPDASGQLGVGVQVETDRGRVKAPHSGHAYTVKDDSKPGESEVTKRKK